MKNLLKIIIVATIVFSIFNCQNGNFSNTANQVLGDWEGVNDSNEKIQWSFKDDGKAQTIRGNEYTEWVYQILNNIEPYQMDLQLEGDTNTLRIIYKFADDGKLIVGVGDPVNVRPNAFNGGETLILNRK